MIWISLNATLALLVCGLATYKLLAHFDDFKPIERVGLGIMAGSVLLTLPPLVVEGGTPFDDWSPAALRLGIALYLAGKVERLLRHARNNRRQLKFSQTWMKGRDQ
ncbi:hypothetical protein [Sphingomonas sp.]|jgi:hypothetical protein|uniref:hypothetical protein n=1 Tax=Sphingomonas sp. TaxID=28214 RepID=UPI00261BE3D9|nr:hypothetical protein [Sphingomonas sp.]MDF2603028.1 hypothetical protein [Sphingomonas sp.]